jgi:fucose permease
MASRNGTAPARSLAVLHPVFLLTGVLHAIGGPLLPSLASNLKLNDNQSGLIFLFYFGGTSIGALLCVGKYAQLMAIGFSLVAICCCAIAWVTWPLQLVVFAAMGVGVGLPMSAVTLFAGRAFPERLNPVLVLLNFTWSAGALIAPLFAARVLLDHTFRAAYAMLAGASIAAALMCLVWLRDPPEKQSTPSESIRGSTLRAVALFAIAAFLQVGVENTAASWLATYTLRTSQSGPALAAIFSGLYWTGFLASRALSSLILLRVKAFDFLRVVLPGAFVAALLIYAASSHSLRGVVMFLLGATCAPIYPLIVAGSLHRVPQIAATRWVLAAAGVGGSILPWLTGWISVQSGSIRTAMLTLPAGLLALLVLLPILLQEKSSAPKA